MSSLYAAHFHLKESPFSIAPNPRFLFMSEQHREALAHLLYGIDHDGGFVLLTGEVGTGKTTLCRCLLEKMPEDTDVAFIINPRLSVVDLLANICDELRIDYPKDTQSNRVLVDAINHYLLDRHAAGRKTVLIIDEAQNLDAEVLEQLRLLTNLETDERKLLQIILLGQPELQEKLAHDQLRQLSQRITARYHLSALSRNDMQAYIGHRLAVAGCEQAIFTPAALRFVFNKSRGIPRLVNLICDRAMLGAFAGNVTRIKRSMVRKAAREVLGEEAAQEKHRPGLIWAAAGIIVAAVLATTAGQWLTPRAPAPVPDTANAAIPNAPASAKPPVTPPVSQPAAPAAAGDTTRSVATTASETVAEGTAAAPEEASGSKQATAQPVAADFTKPRHDAFAAVLGSWGIVPDAGSDPCSFAATRGLACLQQSGDIGRLRALDRPAVLAWQGDDGQTSYVALLGLHGSTARLAGNRGSDVELPVAQLQQHWLDRFTILWRIPDAYQDPIQPGIAGPSARWLNRRLALLDAAPGEGVDDAGIPAYYQGDWVQRLRRFQRAAGLHDDGVAGPQTLIELNSKLHAPGPRLLTRNETATGSR